MIECLPGYIYGNHGVSSNRFAKNGSYVPKVTPCCLHIFRRIQNSIIQFTIPHNNRILKKATNNWFNITTIQIITFYQHNFHLRVYYECMKTWNDYTLSIFGYEIHKWVLTNVVVGDNDCKMHRLSYPATRWLVPRHTILISFILSPTILQ